MSKIVTEFLVFSKSSLVRTMEGIVLKIKSNVPIGKAASFKESVCSAKTDAWALSVASAEITVTWQERRRSFSASVRPHLPYPNTAHLLPERLTGLFFIASQITPSAVAMLR